MTPKDDLETKRIEWRTATPERQAEIEREVAALKADHCYQCNTPLPDNHPSHFCTQACKDEFWKTEHKPEGHKWTLEEMRLRVEQLKNEAKLMKYGYKQQLPIEIFKP